MRIEQASKEGNIEPEIATTLPYDSAVVEHITKIELARLVANHSSVWSGVPHLITWARFKNILSSLASTSPDYVDIALSIIRGTSTSSELQQAAFMPLFLRSFLQNKIVKLIIQSPLELENAISIDHPSCVDITPVRIVFPNAHGDSTEMHLEGLSFRNIKHSEFEHVVRLKYAQSDSCSLEDIHLLEDLDLPLHLTKFESFSNLHSLSISAKYS